jgi:deazaflavin-dependent oxidoreductase (nitroreductase family)
MTFVWVLVALVALLALVFLVFFLGMRGKWGFVQRGVRRMNRRFMNPRQMRTAGSPGAYAGVIHHVGRVSGKQYATPVGPFPVKGGFVINLPYGTSPDWVRNVLAAGRATLVVNGETHQLVTPEVVAVADIADQLPAKELSTMRAFAVRQSLLLRYPPAG